MQRTFTEPWLTLALACASVLAAYNGLVRRRVTETVGQAFLLLAMTAAGMWVMLDPAGTVGAVGGWANQASLGTLAVTARDEIRAERARARGTDLLAERSGRQLSQEGKAARATFVVANDGAVGELEERLRELWPRLRSARRDGS